MIPEWVFSALVGLKVTSRSIAIDIIPKTASPPLIDMSRDIVPEGVLESACRYYSACQHSNIYSISALQKICGFVGSYLETNMNARTPSPYVMPSTLNVLLFTPIAGAVHFHTLANLSFPEKRTRLEEFTDFCANLLYNVSCCEPIFMYVLRAVQGIYDDEFGINKRADNVDHSVYGMLGFGKMYVRVEKDPIHSICEEQLREFVSKYFVLDNNMMIHNQYATMVYEIIAQRSTIILSKCSLSIEAVLLLLKETHSPSVLADARVISFLQIVKYVLNKEASNVLDTPDNLFVVMDAQTIGYYDIMMLMKRSFTKARFAFVVDPRPLSFLGNHD